MSRIRVKYTKGETVKYISHLDTLRTFNRALKRAELPIAYSQGFNPHPLVSFGLPLSVGVTSEAEYADIDFIGNIECSQVIKAFNNAMPEGIRIIEANLIDNNVPSIAGSIVMADYRVTVFLKEEVSGNLSDMLEKVISLNEILVQKQKKGKVQEVDIAPDIHTIDIMKNEGKTIVFNMKLNAGSKANLKPELVIQAIEKYSTGFEVDYMQIHRTNLIFECYL